MAFNLGNLFVNIGGRTSDLTRAERRARKSLNNIEREGDKVKAAVDTMLDDANTRKLKRAERRAVGSMRKMRDSARSARRAVAGIFVGFSAVRLVQEAAKAEFTFRTITGLVGVAREEVAKFQVQARRLTGTTGRSYTELAEALFFITSAGARGRVALEILEKSAQASAGGLGETKAIADAVTSAINTYGEEVLNAAKATDILTAAVREGKLEASTLAPALGPVLPVARALNVSFNEVSAAIAAFSRVGLDPNLAVTYFRAFLSGIQSPAEQTRALLRSIGFSFAELQDDITNRGLLAALQNLKRILDENNIAIARIFPDVRSLTGALNLMADETGSVAQIFEAMLNPIGATGKAFVETVDTMQQRWAKAVNAMGAATSDLILNTFTPVLEGLTYWLEEFGFGLSAEEVRIRSLRREIHNLGGSILRIETRRRVHGIEGPNDENYLLGLRARRLALQMELDRITGIEEPATSPTGGGETGGGVSEQQAARMLAASDEQRALTEILRKGLSTREELENQSRQKMLSQINAHLELGAINEETAAMQRAGINKIYDERIAKIKAGEAKRGTQAIQGENEKRISNLEQSLKTELELEQERYAQSLEILKEAEMKKLRTQEEIADLREKVQTQHEKKVQDLTQDTFHILRQELQSWSDSFADALTRGEVRFGDFLESLARRLLFAQISKGLNALVDVAINTFAGTFNSAGGGTAVPRETQRGSNGAIVGGERLASGGILTSPTRLFGAGVSGIAGESGPEAILPLQRTASGDLGIRALGGGGGVPNVVINIHEGDGGGGGLQVAEQNASFRPDEVIIDVILEDQNRNGRITQGFAGAFGLNRQV